VSLGARGIQRQPDELLVGELGLARFVGGLDFLGRLDEGLGDFDCEGSVGTQNNCVALSTLLL
jgi:hypothetical protein